MQLTKSPPRVLLPLDLDVEVVPPPIPLSHVLSELLACVRVLECGLALPAPKGKTAFASFCATAFFFVITSVPPLPFSPSVSASWLVEGLQMKTGAGPERSACVLVDRPTAAT